MNRVIVIGCPGSGKSVFSRQLGALVGIPVVHLDNLYWNSDRTKVPQEEFLSRLRSAMAADEWIIDGNYASTMEMRMSASDTVIFLDYPSEVCMDGIRERRGKPRPDMPWYERDGDDDAEFVSFVENYRRDSRPTVLQLLSKYSEYKEKNMIVFEERADAEAFLEELKNNKQ